MYSINNPFFEIALNTDLDNILKWCKDNHWSNPCFINGEWWAIAPNKFIPEPVCKSEEWQRYSESLSRVEAAQIEKTFFELANQWRRETNHMSIMSDIILHPAYQRIIGMGLDVVPLILRELSKEPDHWFWALRSITGANPVKPEDKGRLKKMAEAWLDWGRQHGYKC